MIKKLKLAFLAFANAWRHPKQMREYLEGQSNKAPPAASENTHLRLLSMLQHSGRLLDFLKEDIAPFTDAQVGAAVRQIHSSTAKTLEEIVTIRPLMEEAEGASVVVPRGYNPSEIKVVGNVKGEPPFKGVVRHRGWKAHKISLPKQVGAAAREVLAPAEIEIGG
jgi:hypothetical protein